MLAAKLFGEPSRLYQMVSIANVWIYFRYAKEKGRKKSLAIIKYDKAENKIITNHLQYLIQHYLM